MSLRTALSVRTGRHASIPVSLAAVALTLVLVGFGRTPASAAQVDVGPEGLALAGTHVRDDEDATRAKFGVDARATIRPATLGMNRDDRRAKCRVGSSARTRRTTPPFVETAVRDGEDTIKTTHGMLRSLLLDERVLHRDSLTKNALAVSIGQRNA